MKNNKFVGDEIPIQILKESEFTFEIVTNCINRSLAVFWVVWKKQISLPFFKKDDPHDKSNYRSVSILPLISSVRKTDLQSITRIHRKIFKSCFVWF